MSHTPFQCINNAAKARESESTCELASQNASSPCVDVSSRMDAASSLMILCIHTLLEI